MISPSRAAITWSIALACCFAIFVGALRGSGPIRSVAVRSILAAADYLPRSDEQGRTNILLLGIGGEGHAAPDLTDTIIIASVDPKARSISLLSIPRDTAVFDADGRGYGKINSLYYQYRAVRRREKNATQTGASLLAMKDLGAEIGGRTGMTIHGVMKMDFTGFEAVIDSLGGLRIDVPKTIIDDSFPLEEGVIGTFRISKGPQHMDGETALRYARSRHSTSDFDRSDRQQLILSAALDKVRQMNILGNSEFIDSVRSYLVDHFETTLSFRELFGLGALALSVPSDRIIRMGLNNRTGGDYTDAYPGSFLRPDGGSGSTSVLPISPKGDESDWSRIREFTIFYMNHRDLYADPPILMLRRAGASPLHMQRLRNELVRYGFTVEKEKENILLPETSRIQLLESGDRKAADILGELLDLPVLDIAGPESSKKLLILLGKDYRFVPFALP